VEVALTAEVAHLGLPVREVPVSFDHQGTGRDAAGFAHRGRQFWDVVRVVAATGYGIGWPALAPGRVRLRLATWIAGLLAVMALCWTTAPLALPWLAAACGAALLVWLPCLWIAGVWLGLRRPNYLGRMVPSATGIIFPAVCLPIFWATPLSEEVRAAGVAVVGVMGAVGLLDDMFGSRRQARGLRGHLLALLRGQLTTGILKAVGGLAVGVWAGLLLDWGEPWLIATDAVLIALAANAANLLDLRPGRALKGFVVLAGVLLLSAPNAIHLLGPLLAAAVVSAPADLSGRAMMGDVGSNVLGGVVGLLLAIVLGPWQRLGAVAMLMLFHLLCERLSLSALIARSPFLNAIDRLGTAHLPPLTPAETRQQWA
jgi:UDP-N-acetylmuramyl pentapeptide phosphotransferase/UDP-N-acetylglucosamine-1-phosphate transferase